MKKWTSTIKINVPKASFHWQGSGHQDLCLWPQRLHIFAFSHCNCYRQHSDKCPANMSQCRTFVSQNLSSVVVFVDQLVQLEFYPAALAVSLIALFAWHGELIHHSHCHISAASHTAVLLEGAWLKAEAFYAGSGNTMKIKMNKLSDYTLPQLTVEAVDADLRTDM